MKLKAAVIIPSGRPYLLENTLNCFYKFWNNKYNYPVFIHTLGEKYTEPEKKYFQKKFRNLEFFTVKPYLPKNLKQNEFFYNRFYNSYAYNSFGIRRLGYLQSIYFGSNISSFGKEGCLSKKLSKYDYIMRIDDDAWFKKKIDYDLFKKMGKFPMATGRLGVYKKKILPMTRENLFLFLKKYIKKNKIKIKLKLVRDIFKSNNEEDLNRLEYSLGNFDVYNMKYFKSKKFANFISSVNNLEGQFRYRWADYDITNLFVYIILGKKIKSYELADDTYIASHPNAKIIRDKTNPIDFIFYLFRKRIYKLKKFFS